MPLTVVHNNVCALAGVFGGRVPYETSQEAPAPTPVDATATTAAGARLASPDGAVADVALASDAAPLPAPIAIAASRDDHSVLTAVASAASLQRAAYAEQERLASSALSPPPLGAVAHLQQQRAGAAHTAAVVAFEAAGNRAWAALRVRELARFARATTAYAEEAVECNSRCVLAMLQAYFVFVFVFSRDVPLAFSMRYIYWI